MIRYHGGPITPETAAAAAWRRSHAMISFAHPDQAALAFAVADSVCLDNGAWPIFAAGKGAIDVPAYLEWVKTWYASVDSTNVARNIGIDSAWTGSYIPKRKETRAMLLRDNIENHASAARWNGPIPRNMELFG